MENMLNDIVGGSHEKDIVGSRRRFGQGKGGVAQRYNLANRILKTDERDQG